MPLAKKVCTTSIARPTTSILLVLDSSFWLPHIHKYEFKHRKRGLINYPMTSNNIILRS